jgi:hypothetical protein
MRLYASALPAAARASLAAGPVFIISALFFVPFESVGNQPISLDPGMLAIFPALLIAIPFGLILAIVPNILGAVTLRWLGSGNIGLRTAPVWGLAGAAATGLPLTLCGTATGPVGHALIATGAINALLCRAGVHWPD